MKILGLTGGIGTGKSTVSEYLKTKGCTIIDADAISRGMTEKGSPALDEIKNCFGEEYFFSDGSLNRKLLGDFVFGDSDKLAQLQEIITKKVAENIKNKISGLKEAGFEGIIVVDAPLLFECGMQDMADENWLVIASLPVRISRVGKRDGLSEAQIVSRINNQMPQREKEKLSKCILDNSGSLEELYVQIDTNLERIRNEG